MMLAWPYVAAVRRGVSSVFSSTAFIFLPEGSLRSESTKASKSPALAAAWSDIFFSF